ncbi:hypothetical protein [Maribacter sp. 2307ULW6-5]
MHHLLARFTDRAIQIYQTIRQRVAAPEVLGAEETGLMVNGKKLLLGLA